MRNTKIPIVLFILLSIAFLPYHSFAQNNCLDFDGTDDYVDCGNDASLNITSAITIETWINGTAGTVSSQTITLRPDQAGDENTWTSGTYSSVNDQSDATYLESSGGVSPQWQEGLFSTADHPAGRSGTINWVKVHIRYKDDATLLIHAKVRTSMKTNGTEYDGTDVTCSHSWANTYTEYTTNPATVSDWTWNDIDNIQIGADGQGAGTLLLPVKAQVAEVWLEVSYTPPAIIVGKGTNAYELGIDTDSYIWGHINEQTVSSQVSAGWHHVALTYNKDAGSNQQKLYIDGVLAAQSILSAFISTNSNILKIGESFSGAIDEVRIWSDVRTQAEIRANMYKELTGTEANLVAYYKLNETTGITADNAEGTAALDGTLNNMTNNDWVNSGAYAGPGNCLLFDGVDEYIDIGTGPIAVQSVEFWVYPSSTTEYFVDLNGSAYISSSSGTISATGFTSPTIYVDGVESTTIESGTWQHIAVTTGTSINATDLDIGRLEGQEEFDGKIDEVCLWSDVRTATEISDNMCRTLDGDENGIIAYYRFDQKNSSGQTTLYDITSTGNHGTLTNMEATADWVNCEAFDTWIGWLSDSWSTAANWSDGVPDATDNVGIPYWILGHSPTLSGNPTVNNIVIGLLATLNLNSDFTINRHYFELGSLSPGTNTVTFGGSSKQYLVGINLGFYNLTINNTHASDKVSTWWCTSLSVSNNLTITDGIFYSKSDYNNVSIGTDGTLELSGDITVSGNWNNSGKFTHNNHKVTFDGSSAQTIQGANSITFYDLTVNNSSTGVTLSKAIDVNYYLILTNGDIDLNGNTIVLGTTGTLEETGGLITGTSGGTITTTRTFISGISSDNIGGLGAEITTLTSMGETTITRCHTAQTGGGSSGIKRYYDITPTNNINLNATLVLHYADSELNGITAGNLELFRSTDGGSTWTSRGGTVSTNTITVTGINAFSRWTAGDKNNPLPVELSSFTANCMKGTVTLNWTTESEINNSGYDIERKRTENANWKKIGFVEGHGTVNTPQSYMFTDKNLTTGKYNYRLKQIDHNGNFEYFNLSSDVIVGAPSKFNVSQNYPNPFNPKTKINFELPNDSKVSIKIFDMLGREVVTLVNGFKEAGYHTVEFDGCNLSSGMYFYRIHTESFEAVKRMLLVK